MTLNKVIAYIGWTLFIMGILFWTWEGSWRAAITGTVLAIGCLLWYTQLDSASKKNNTIRRHDHDQQI